MDDADEQIEKEFSLARCERLKDAHLSGQHGEVQSVVKFLAAWREPQDARAPVRIFDPTVHMTEYHKLIHDLACACAINS